MIDFIIGLLLIIVAVLGVSVFMILITPFLIPMLCLVGLVTLFSLIIDLIMPS